MADSEATKEVTAPLLAGTHTPVPPMRDSVPEVDGTGATADFVPAEFVNIPVPSELDEGGMSQQQQQVPGGGGKGGGMPGLSSLHLTWAHLSLARSWIVTRRQNLRPWGHFVNTNRCRKPRSVQQFGKRVVRNVDYFHSNYLCVFIGLFIFCVLTSPMLLVALAASVGACYILTLRNRESKVHILGREVTLAQQYAGVGLLSIPVFWLVGAGSAIFWIIGASIVTILLHAALYSPEDENPEDLFELSGPTSVETV